MTKTVYVIEAYWPHGGTFMAYHIAKILHERFGYDVCVLTSTEHPEEQHLHGVFHYDPVFPCLPLSDCESLLTSDDVLLCNPSFSSLNLGLKARGFKICYVQGFTTFRFLDMFFDHYVAVSHFVRDFLCHVYRLEAPVIPPFLCETDAPGMTRVPWRERPTGSLVLNVKRNRPEQLILLEKLRRLVGQRDPAMEAAIDWGACIKDAGNPLPHARFLEKLASARYLLTLSASEGFGLVPLEAMSLGTAVIGFDGYGGRDYMISGGNCEVAEYPNLPAVADSLVAVMRDDEYAVKLAAAGMATARRYTYEAFRKAWISELERILPR